MMTETHSSLNLTLEKTEAVGVERRFQFTQNLALDFGRFVAPAIFRKAKMRMGSRCPLRIATFRVCHRYCYG